MSKYEEFTFDCKYKEENQDDRYERLLREFNAKFAQHLVELYEEEKEKSEDDADRKEFAKCIAAYKQQMTQLHRIITYFSKQTLKENSDDILLSIGGYPRKAYLIELLARLSTTIDEPGNNENKAQLLNLANKIPKDTQGYWRHIKIGIIFVLTEAATMGVILGTIFLFPPTVAPITIIALTAVALGMIPCFLGSCLIATESIEIDRTSNAQKIKSAITNPEHTFFSSNISGDNALNNPSEVTPVV